MDLSSAPIDLIAQRLDAGLIQLGEIPFTRREAVAQEAARIKKARAEAAAQSEEAKKNAKKSKK